MVSTTSADFLLDDRNCQVSARNLDELFSRLICLRDFRIHENDGWAASHLSRFPSLALSRALENERSSGPEANAIRSVFLHHAKDTLEYLQLSFISSEGGSWMGSLNAFTALKRVHLFKGVIFYPSRGNFGGKTIVEKLTDFFPRSIEEIHIQGWSLRRRTFRQDREREDVEWHRKLETYDLLSDSPTATSIRLPNLRWLILGNWEYVEDLFISFSRSEQNMEEEVVVVEERVREEDGGGTEQVKDPLYSDPSSTREICDKIFNSRSDRHWPFVEFHQWLLSDQRKLPHKLQDPDTLPEFPSVGRYWPLR